MYLFFFFADTNIKFKPASSQTPAYSITLTFTKSHSKIHYKSTISTYYTTCTKISRAKTGLRKYDQAPLNPYSTWGYNNSEKILPQQSKSTFIIVINCWHTNAINYWKHIPSIHNDVTFNLLFNHPIANPRR